MTDIAINIPEDMLDSVSQAIENQKRHNKKHKASENTELTQFPFEVFPKKIQAFIRDLEAGLNFNPDYTSGAVLFTAATAIGNSYTIEVMPGWKDYAIIFICAVGRPGANKSHPFSSCLAPIFKYDKEQYEAYKRLYDEYKHAQSLSKTERQEQSIELTDEPKLKKKLVSDITIEALASVLSDNPSGLGLYVDELVAWVKNFGRYNNGSDVERWLSNFSSKLISTDRKGSSSIRIDNPVISVGGTIQPGVLLEMSKGGAQNGFLDRIVWIYPIDDKKKCWSKESINPEIITAYNQIIEDLLRNISEPEENKVIPFCSEAFQLIASWQKQNTDRINAEENEHLAGIHNKLEIYCIRISLILQVLRYAAGETPSGWEDNKCIESVSVEGAIKIVSYFGYTARKVYYEIHEKNAVDQLPGDKRKFYEGLPEVFKTEQAVKLSESYDMAERTVKRFLKDAKLFKQIKHGTYEKLL